MNKKQLSLITVALALILAIPALTGCISPAIAQGTTEQVQVSQQPQGIWVNGTGEITVTPDIATLSLGIVAQEESVALAQTKASESMTKVMEALTDSGIAEKDIQTGYFSINQRTRWDDQKQTEVVTGYQVTNMVTIKIRDTAKVGSIIDSVVRAGGDLVRMRDINFSVEDSTNYYEEARKKAMANAKRKAEQLADLAGLNLGKPTYIAEGSQYTPVYNSNRGMDMVMSAPVAEAMTVAPISAGEIKITLNIQVAYSTVE